MNDDAELIDRLAAWSHKSWAGWTAWMIEKWDVTHDSGETFQARWKRQIATPYEALSEQEKESDRSEAREILAIVRAHDYEHTPIQQFVKEVHRAWAEGLDREMMGYQPSPSAKPLDRSKPPNVGSAVT